MVNDNVPFVNAYEKLYEGCFNLDLRDCELNNYEYSNNDGKLIVFVITKYNMTYVVCS